MATAISIIWARTAYGVCKPSPSLTAEQFTHLAGIAAPADFHNLVVYKVSPMRIIRQRQAMTFSDEILQVDTCRVYHSGPHYFVEIDIVLPPDMPLWRAHDISQDLQDQIEALPDVDRCFVHVDHEVSHKPVSVVCLAELIARSIGRSNELCRRQLYSEVSELMHRERASPRVSRRCVASAVHVGGQEKSSISRVSPWISLRSL